MDKKVEKNVTSNKKEANQFLLVILILLFCFTLYISLQYIIKYHEKENYQINSEVIEIKTKDISASILNSEKITQVINNKSFKEKDEIIVERINFIDVKSTKETKIKFNVKYNISKNNFENNLISSNKSELLVRFSYSYDNETWTYVNNVISTNSSNISPLIGNNYDIAGLITTLNVATDFEVAVDNANSKKIYWRSETIFKNLETQFEAAEFEKELNANFTIEYKTSD